MSNLNQHHIIYDKKMKDGGFCVEIPDWGHKFISIIQRMNATKENYVIISNLMHSLAFEWGRIRMELDQKEEE